MQIYTQERGHMFHVHDLFNAIYMCMFQRRYCITILDYDSNNVCFADPGFNQEKYIRFAAITYSFGT